MCFKLKLFTNLICDREKKNKNKNKIASGFLKTQGLHFFVRQKLIRRISKVELTAKVKPKDLGVDITTSFKKGGLILQCSGSKNIIDLQNEIQKNMGDKCEIRKNDLK